ncbi:hypothetical protein M3P21_19795 [Ruegeria sp. 2012CJ41-6]|uniref:V-type ATP synthase subunit C n=1 Tax=Ruegeria spongiae TaxID=2942209 RepID=A0ABT0Q7C7_9RHOB|nr:hypothetical protein [Ruegeria spongiae]MCL6285771.1 hypothetical protein [Ruegeria spongiae]
MSDPDAYIALVSSLPSSERLFVAKQPPLSELRLRKRLSALDEDDAKTLHRIEHILSWASYDAQAEIGEVVKRARSLLRNLPQPTLRAIVADRMELRSAIAALRMRRDGMAAPSGQWGFGKWTRHIAANWSDPTFRLDAPLPWLREAGSLLEAGDALGLERHLLEIAFRQLQRHGGLHHFDFEAVVIYVLKWTLFDRWAASDAQAAARRFAQLSDDALQDFPDLMLEGGTG